MLFIRRLVWDPWNVAHIARHGVLPEEVEQVCHGDPMFRASYKGQLLVIGPTQSNRMLTVALDPEGDDFYYPVTAHPASRKESHRYRAAKGGETL